VPGADADGVARDWHVPALAGPSADHPGDRAHTGDAAHPGTSPAPDPAKDSDA
jgi:hypothetical protein